MLGPGTGLTILFRALVEETRGCVELVVDLGHFARDWGEDVGRGLDGLDRTDLFWVVRRGPGLALAHRG